MRSCYTTQQRPFEGHAEEAEEEEEDEDEDEERKRRKGKKKLFKHCVILLGLFF